MSIVVKNISLSKNEVATKEYFKISVKLWETPKEPEMYRLPVKLGKEKGVVK